MQITITSNDGSSSSNNSVTLTWSPPTQRMNGDNLSSSEISGYRVYYGTSSGVYTSTREVAASSCNPCTITITDLSGTYYFSVTATDTSANESGYSNEVSKTF